jgi:hypothetical protein
MGLAQRGHMQTNRRADVRVSVVQHVAKENLHRMPDFAQMNSGSP